MLISYINMIKIYKKTTYFYLLASKEKHVFRKVLLEELDHEILSCGRFSPVFSRLPNMYNFFNFSLK